MEIVPSFFTLIKKTILSGNKLGNKHTHMPLMYLPLISTSLFPGSITRFRSGITRSRSRKLRSFISLFVRPPQAPITLKTSSISRSEFEFGPFSRRGKRKNENGSPISFFHCKEKRKTKIKFEFHFPMQLKIGCH